MRVYGDLCELSIWLIGCDSARLQKRLYRRNLLC